MQAMLVEQDADMDQRIKTLADMLIKRDMVDYDMHKKIAKMWFSDLHKDYYLTYIAKARKYIRGVIIAPNYIIVHVRHGGQWSEEKYYAIGIDTDTDTLFINRVRAPPPPGQVYRVNDVDVEHATDLHIKQLVFEYDIDIVDTEFTIVLGALHDRRFRVQGDIVFNVMRYAGADNVLAWAREEIIRYIAYLLADKIIALLADYGISGELVITERNMYAIRIRGGTNSSRWSGYARKNRARIAKILSEYFDTKLETPATFAEITISDGAIRGRLEIVSRAYFSSHYGDTFIVIREISSETILNKMVHDMTELFNTLPPMDIVRNYGNHRIELRHVVPVAFSYMSDIKPLYLEPQAIYVIARNSFIVDGESIATLIHKEHGMRRVKFADKYVLNITTTLHDDDDITYRNRVALRRISTHKT
jgi:hypothetical protein